MVLLFVITENSNVCFLGITLFVSLIKKFGMIIVRTFTYLLVELQVLLGGKLYQDII